MFAFLSIDVKSDVLSSTSYKYVPNLESLLTQQYVCVNVHSDLIIHAFSLVFIA
jgi:hypothetical protein